MRISTNRPPTTMIYRTTLIVSVISGFFAIWLFPPDLYFRVDRFASGLPQPYFGFDPDRFLADAPLRGPSMIAFLIAAKFFVGVLLIWIIYGVGRYIVRGSAFGNR